MSLAASEFVQFLEGGKNPGKFLRGEGAFRVSRRARECEVRAAALRILLCGDEKLRIWLNTPNELLERKPPNHWIAAGKALEVSEFVQDALAGQPT